MENWCNDTARGDKPAPMTLCSMQTKRERESVCVCVCVCVCVHTRIQDFIDKMHLS